MSDGTRLVHGAIPEPTHRVIVGRDGRAYWTESAGPGGIEVWYGAPLTGAIVDYNLGVEDLELNEMAYPYYDIPLYPRESDGCTYFRVKGDWMSAPTYIDGTPDFNSACHIEDLFLDDTERADMDDFLMGCEA